MDPFIILAETLIIERAAKEHSEKCAHPRTCSDWHIQNDYVPRVRRQVVSEMLDAIHQTQISD